MKGLGYGEPVSAEQVKTREGLEDGGYIPPGGEKRPACGCGRMSMRLTLDAPTKRGLNHRFSPTRWAERVLLATGGTVGAADERGWNSG